MPAQAKQPTPPVTTPGEAEELLTRITDVMGRLQQVVQEETDLLRAGRVDMAARLAKSKSELARAYAADIARFKASNILLLRTMPDRLAALDARHERFRSLLQLNLTVVATAHAVSEGIIRGVAGEITRRAAPQTYGATGRATPAPKTGCRPIAVSRTL